MKLLAEELRNTGRERAANKSLKKDAAKNRRAVITSHQR